MSERGFAVRGEVVHVPMRDGVRLSAHLHRPDAEGRFPAILQCTPYRKGRIGAHHPIVEHGYATVMFDVRGTGDSEGWTDSVYSDAERLDCCEMVEWAAGQPWCNGNVGMWGISYGAVAALQTAGEAPPHLKAIIACSGTDDPYADWTNPGGSPRPYIYACYAPIMTASNFLPPDPDGVGDRWEAMWAERLERSVPWGIAFIENLSGGPFWRARALRGRYDRVRCPVFGVSGWADWYPTPLLRVFANLGVPGRALIGPWSHQFPDGGIPGPRVEWLSQALGWFDRWLKGADNAGRAEPPVTLFVRDYRPPATIVMEDRGEFRCEREWPIARALETPWFLRGQGRLIDEWCMEPGEGEGETDSFAYDPRVGACAGVHGGGPFNVNWVMPLDQRPDDAVSLCYTSEPLEEDAEVTGVPRAILYVSSTAAAALVSVRLCDVAPDGTSALVTKGCLNLAHGASGGGPSPVEPGRVYQVEVELLACAYCFGVGHRMRVAVAGSDFPNAWPTPHACTTTLWRTADRPSCILLPMVPPREPALPAPALAFRPPARLEDLQAPAFVLSRDVIGETVSVEYSLSYGPRWDHRARYTVSAKDPARASAEATARRGGEFAGRDVVVDARCVTSSDEREFRHTAEVEITVDGRPHFRKSWSASAPRRLM